MEDSAKHCENRCRPQTVL